jgi:predicted phage terminase large subunit-like protein
VPFQSGWHLEVLCAHLEACALGQITDLLINVPPGTTKSLTTSVFWPAWQWTWQPWSRWLTGGYDARLAIRDALRTRRLMQSAWYQQRWHDVFAFSGDQNVKSYYSNNRTGWRLATSMQGGVTGEHAHFLVIDDPHNVHEAESDTERDNVLQIWREVYPSRRLPGGVRVVVGQRVHEEDLTNDWLERESGRIHHIELPMEYDPLHVRDSQLEPCAMDGHLHDRRAEAQAGIDPILLSPGRFTRETVEQLKVDLGPYAYSAQYDQRPSPRAGMLLNPAWFVDRPAHLDVQDMDLVCAFDLNYSEKDASDWTVGIVAAVERDARWPVMHLLDVYAEHLSEMRHEVELGRYLELWKPMLVGIEKRAFEKQGATQDLVRSLQASLDFSPCHIEPVEADSDKLSRAMIIAGRAKAGLITVDRTAPWWHALSVEMSRFPRSQHDDRVDALAYTVRLAVQRLQKVRALILLMTQPVPFRVAGQTSGGYRPGVGEMMGDLSA